MGTAVARRIETIKQRGGIKAREVAQLLDTTPETVSRWQAGKVEPQQGRLEKLLTLEWLLDELAEIYPPEEVRLWLFASHKLLAGEAPANRIQQGKTADVLAIIYQLRDGAYV
ncbi:MAG TPA: helix-turn-helix domain-containing protein [Thermoanaerobaculia bacterium]|nr:helix-turn-helix domain-containing protein [Thermoanaerobaculia bacterium]